MLTATKDLMLPATVTGSWPRPRWYDGGLWGRPLDTALLDVRFREQFLDAHSTVIADQERAGLDILTNGDYHLDEDFAGRSWHHYPLQRWKGLEHEELQYERSRDRLLEFPPGTLMNEIETTWRWPRVVGKVEHDPRNPLEYAKLWRIAQARAGKPVKFGTCSSQVLSIFLDSHTDRVRPRGQEAADLGHGQRDEHRASPAGGRRRQGDPDRGADDPLRRAASTPTRPRCSTSSSTRSTTRWTASTTSSCGSTPAGATRTCRRSTPASRTRTRSRSTSSASRATSGPSRRPRTSWPRSTCSSRIAGRLKKKVAVGVVNHRTLQADMPPVVAARVRRALEVHPGRQADPVQRLRVRPAGVQPDHRVLQDDGDRAGAEHRPQGARRSRSATCRRPTRPCRSTCFRTASR